MSQVSRQVPEQKCNQVEKEECYDVPRQVNNLYIIIRNDDHYK